MSQIKNIITYAKRLLDFLINENHDRCDEAMFGRFVEEDLLRRKFDPEKAKKLSPKEKSILTFIENHAGCKSGEIAKKLGIPSPTVKRILPELIKLNLIEKYGTGPGTNYSIK